MLTVKRKSQITAKAIKENGQVSFTHPKCNHFLCDETGDILPQPNIIMATKKGYKLLLMCGPKSHKIEKKFEFKTLVEAKKRIWAN